MNKTEDDELTDESLSDDEIRSLSEGKLKLTTVSFMPRDYTIETLKLLSSNRKIPLQLFLFLAMNFIFPSNLMFSP